MIQIPDHPEIQETERTGYCWPWNAPAEEEDEDD